MYENGFTMHEWRKQAVTQYRRYLDKIPPDSEEYREIIRGIETLENVSLQ
jgi:hypothetical protein